MPRDTFRSHDGHGGRRISWSNGAFVNANFIADCPLLLAQTARNRGQKSARLRAHEGVINCAL